MSDFWEIYKDAEENWRWRRTSPNGNIVGSSSQGYSNKADCEGNARRNGWVEEDTEISSEANKIAVEQELKDEKKQLKESKKEFKEAKKEFKDEKNIERESGLSLNKQMRNILLTIAGILIVIVVILLIMLFKRNSEVDLSKESLSDLKVMMLVLDPKEDENVVVFGDTHFDFGKSTLSRDAQMLLNKNVQVLKENPETNVRIAGYTSAQGSKKVNQKLSERRANSVRNYLIKAGVVPGRISVIGYGRTRPALYEVRPANIHSKEAMANMRVLFEIEVK